MRIHPLSDLHMEFHQSTRHYAGEQDYPKPSNNTREIDVLIAAGDIHLGTLAPAWLRRLYRAKRILYVPGNHEYYGERLDQLDDQLRIECRRHDVDFLQCDAVEIDGVVFLGCTLWTDFAAFEPVVSVVKAGHMAEEALADYKRIKTEHRSEKVPRKIAWRDTAEIYRRHYAWLETEIERYRRNPLMIITHHAPSLSLSHPEYRSDPLTAAFCNRIGDLVERSRAIYWICGHSHWPMQVRIGQTTVVNNSCGYPGELSGERFDANLVLEI
jgi:predicted phosphodiesterase